MKRFFFSALVSAIVLVLLVGCGADGGSGGDSGGDFGTLSIDITDARSMLPAGTTEVNITIDAISVHQKGGEWVDCELIDDPDPFIVNLLDWHSGNATVLVPNCLLEPGEYTKIRFSISDANIVIDQSAEIAHCVKVPSNAIKTDKNLNFEVVNDGYVALTADFDPGQSIKTAGKRGGCLYILQPVIHLLHTHKAATICGSIDRDTFDGGRPQQAIVTVTWGENLDGFDEVYTKIVVENNDAALATDFCIFWVDPEKDYNVVVEVDDGTQLIEVWDELVDSTDPDLSAGGTFSLKGGMAI